MIEMLKYNDLTKKNENDPNNVKTFRVDYRAAIVKKREDNERMKEELIKRMEEEAKQEVFSFIFREISFFLQQILGKCKSSSHKKIPCQQRQKRAQKGRGENG